MTAVKAINYFLIRGYVTCLLIGFLCIEVTAQRNPNSSSSGANGIGFVMKGNGLGISLYQNISSKSEAFTKFANVDFVSAKHHREVKIVNQGAQNPRPYVYGKLYHTALARLSYGYRKTLIQTNHYNKIGLELLATAGPTIGFLRPVYIDVMTIQPNDQIAAIHSQRFDKNIDVNQDDIAGYSRKSEGWNELKINIGVGLKPGINFYWGSIESTIKNVQVGTMIDYFPGGMQIMAFGENPKMYASPYVAFIWSFRN